MWIDHLAPATHWFCRLELVYHVPSHSADAVESSSWLVRVARPCVATPCKRIRFSRKSPGFYFELTCQGRAVRSSVRSTKREGRECAKGKGSNKFIRQLGPVLHADLHTPVLDVPSRSILHLQQCCMLTVRVARNRQPGPLHVSHAPMTCGTHHASCMRKLKLIFTMQKKRSPASSSSFLPCRKSALTGSQPHSLVPSDSLSAHCLLPGRCPVVVRVLSSHRSLQFGSSLESSSTMGDHTGLLVGISIGVALFVLLLSVLCCLMGWRRRDRQIRRSGAMICARARPSPVSLGLLRVVVCRGFDALCY
jgi:hypothetical protein